MELPETSTVHSGYDFLSWARMHDEHHERFSVWYGSLGWLDWVHGTDGRGGRRWRKVEDPVVKVGLGKKLSAPFAASQDAL